MDMRQYVVLKLLCDLRCLTGASYLKGFTTTVDGKAKSSVNEAPKGSGVRVNYVLRDGVEGGGIC